MNRSELVITIVGLTATFCMPWPCAQKTELGAAELPKHIVRAEQNNTASIPWVYIDVDRVSAVPVPVRQLTR